MSNLIKKGFIMEKEKIAEAYLEVINRAKEILLDMTKKELGLGRKDLIITDFFKEKDIDRGHVNDCTFICITSVIVPSDTFKRLKINSHYNSIELNLSGLKGEYYLTNPILLYQNTPFEYETDPKGNIELRGFKIQKKGLTTLEDKEFELSILK